ncbi:MAG: thioredoxin [Paludibacteraceae bacterium]|nr:thioredoxin [Paludibacteraceae bacterium]MBO7724676.1 thioredoxin [Paludibacteraceae bacterium]
MANQITDANLQEVLDNNLLVVMDFWAEWCGPCRMVAPIVDELAEEYSGKVFIGKVNVDDNNDAVEKYGIRNIPTILFIKNGEIVDKKVGAATKADLKAKIDAML